MQNHFNYDRIPSLDFLRGLAVLGILIINIESFAYFYPFKLMHGFEQPIDVSVRFWVYFLAQGKFFSMFTLLFGAGFYIFMQRLEHKGLGLQALDIYSRRLLILFVFGVIHAYFIWDGDVLYHYAICGMLLFPFRSMSVAKLTWVLLALMSVLLLNSYQRTGVTQKQLSDYQQALSVEESQRSSDQNNAIERWQKKTQKKDLSPIELEPPRSTLRESWSENFSKVQVHKGVVFYQGILFRTLIMMILGILLYKLGVFQNYQSLKHYWKITFAILLLALYMNYDRYHHLTFTYYEPVVKITTGWLHTFPKEILGLAYILLFNGLYQKFLKHTKSNPISKLGKMALSNYIFQSLVCGFLFYGYGLGWFNQFSRSELWMIIPAVWIGQLILSHFWLLRFRQGPLEALWRRWTYAKI